MNITIIVLYTENCLKMSLSLNIAKLVMVAAELADISYMNTVHSCRATYVYNFVIMHIANYVHVCKYIVFNSV